MVTFAGEALFASGPHRLQRASEGTLSVPELDLGNVSAATRLVGGYETWFTLRGRLVGEDLPTLLAQIAGVRAQVTDPPTEGTLVDSEGGEHEKMWLVSLVTTGPIERGRALSIGYEIRFLKNG